MIAGVPIHALLRILPILAEIGTGGMCSSHGFSKNDKGWFDGVLTFGIFFLQFKLNQLIASRLQSNALVGRFDVFESFGTERALL